MCKKKYSRKSYEISISWKEIFVKTILTGSFSAEYLSYTSPLFPHFCVEFKTTILRFPNSIDFQLAIGSIEEN